jgi:hypothetical protein
MRVYCLAAVVLQLASFRSSARAQEQRRAIRSFAATSAALASDNPPAESLQLDSQSLESSSEALLELSQGAQHNVAHLAVFASWAASYGKQYGTTEERAHRLRVWLENDGAFPSIVLSLLSLSLLFIVFPLGGCDKFVRTQLALR